MNKFKTWFKYNWKCKKWLKFTIVVLIFLLIYIGIMGYIVFSPSFCTHKYKVTYRREATCYSSGEIIQTCYRCNNKIFEEIQILEHEFGKQIVVKEPTHESHGKAEKECKVCGYVESKITPKLTGEPTPLPTPTPIPIFKPEDYRNDLTYKDIARYPDKYRGEKVTFKGKVLQEGAVTKYGDRYMRVSVDDDYNKVFYCVYDDSKLDFRILEDDIIIFYGKCAGIMSYESVAGNIIEIPEINVDEIELVLDEIEN